jgi:hypothetical protein
MKGRYVMTLDIHVAPSEADYAANRGIRVFNEYKSLKEFESANNDAPFYARLANDGCHIVVIKRDGWNGSVVGRFDVKRMRTRNYLKLYPAKGNYAHIKASDVRI